MTINVYEPETNFTDHDWDIFSKWLTGVLITHTPTIIFTKKDGSERVMKCTLVPDLLPVQETKTDNPIDLSESKRKINTNTMSVFDVENNGWRSFTIKSVKSVSFPLIID